MEFKDIFIFLKRHIWILLIGCFLGVGIGLLLKMINPFSYEANSKILISRNEPDKYSDYGYLTDAELLQTYSYLLQTKPIIDSVSEKVGSKIEIDNITITPIMDTMIIQISAKDKNPQKAADIANAFADVMVEENQALQASRYASEIESLNSQIEKVETQIGILSSLYDDQKEQIISQVDQQIEDYKTEILDIQTKIALAGTPLTLEDVKILAERNSRLDEIKPLLSLYQQIRADYEYDQRSNDSGNLALTHIESTINQYQKIYLNLLDSLESTKLLQLQNTPGIKVIETAIKPNEPSLPIFLLNPIILGLVGIIAALVFSIGWQYLDTKLYTSKQITDQLGMKVIGKVHTLSWKSGNENFGATQSSTNPTALSIVNIRVALEEVNYHKLSKSFLITSFSKANGKSIFSYNLAHSYAAGNYRVALVDANLSNPFFQKTFEIENENGFGDVLLGDHQYQKNDLQNIGEQQLGLLPAGKVIYSNEKLISLNKANNLLESMKNDNEIIILDCPEITDPNVKILSNIVDGIIILMHPGEVTSDEAKNLIFGLNGNYSKIAGIVINEGLDIAVPSLEPKKEKVKSIITAD